MTTETTTRITMLTGRQYIDNPTLCPFCRHDHGDTLTHCDQCARSWNLVHHDGRLIGFDFTTQVPRPAGYTGQHYAARTAENTARAAHSTRAAAAPNATPATLAARMADAIGIL